MSAYIPPGQPCTPHVKQICNAFDSHLRLSMGSLEPDDYSQFCLVTLSRSKNKIYFGDAWSCWTAMLRRFDRDHPGHSLLYQFLNIPRGIFTMHTWNNPDTKQLNLEITRLTRSGIRKKYVRPLDADPRQVIGRKIRRQ